MRRLINQINGTVEEIRLSEMNVQPRRLEDNSSESFSKFQRSLPKWPTKGPPKMAPKGP